MKMKKDIIYFTKEDGQNKLLSIAHSNCLECVDDITSNLMSFYIKKIRTQANKYLCFS